jgi:hypothetical protein
MKTFMFSTSAWLLAAGLAVAQEPSSSPLVRGDAHFVVGWQNLHREREPGQRYGDDWMNGIFFSGAGAGWYWTDHLKTQVDFGAGTEGRQYRFEFVLVNGQSTTSTSRVLVRQQSLAVAQHYQFFRNQWVHPHLGAGVDIALETINEEYDPVIFGSGVLRQITPARTEGPDRRTIARPFAEAGFKAYMTRRSFFTGDTRLMFKSGLDEVLFRFGFGVDF